MINNKPLMTRIMALVARATADHKKMQDFTQPFNSKEWEKNLSEMEAELSAIDKAAGKGLAIGRCLSFGVADGSASYLITKIRKNDVVVEWVPLCDGYFSDAVGLSRDKRQYVVNRNTAERHIGLSDIFSMDSQIAA